MRTTLRDVFTAARECDCPIVHVSAAAGEEPFIASSPCMGDAPLALLDITRDDYFALMAELRNAMVVEHDETLAFHVYTGSAQSARRVEERLPLAPRTIAGRLDLDGARVAVYYMMDSIGQETTALYCGLTSYAEIQAYWKRRGELVRALAETYETIEEDVHDLCYQLDRTTQVQRFDLAAFARRRGLRFAARAAVNF